MLTLSTRFWWAWFLRGVFAILFGVLAFLLPIVTLTSLAILFGSFMFVDGLLALFSLLFKRQVGRRWWLSLLEGGLGIGIGLLTFWMPVVTALTLLYLVAAWAIVSGIFEIVMAIDLRKVIDNEWALGLTGLLSIILGLVFIAFPWAGFVGLAWMLGTYALLTGILLMSFGLRLRRLHHGERNAYKSRMPLGHT